MINTLIIAYTPNGQAVPDAQAEELVKTWVKEDNGQIHEVSTENVCIAARTLVKEKEIEFNKVQFLFQGMVLKPDVNGRLAEWPDGFCDFTDNWLMRIL